MSADERFTENELSAQLKSAIGAPNMDIFYRDCDRVARAMTLADNGFCPSCGEKCIIDDEKSICPICDDYDYLPENK